MVGKNGTNIIVVLAVCRSWTWLVCICVRLGTYNLVLHLPPWVWIIPFDLSFSHCLVTMTPDPLMSNTAKSTIVPLYVQEKLTSASINLPLILIRFTKKKTSCSSISCRWCGKHYGPPSIKITSCRLQLIIQEVGLETPYGTLEPACLNGRFVAFDVRFSSLASDRVILRVFDASSLIHMP